MEEIHIISDSRQKSGKHDKKEAWWRENGVQVTISKVHVGDYVLSPPVAIDTKRDVLELCQDIDNDHERFRDECKRAKESGTHLVVLVENTDGVSDLATLAQWQNPRRFINAKKGLNPPINGIRLSKACATMERKYNVRFLFCRPEDAARRVVEILHGGCDG